MSEFNLKSGNVTPFKLMGSSPCKDCGDSPAKDKNSHTSALRMMESSSPLRGCAEDPTGKGCGNFKIKGTGKKKINRAIHKAGKWVENVFRKKKKKKNKKKKTSSNTSYQSPRTLSTGGEGGSDYTGG